MFQFRIAMRMLGLGLAVLTASGCANMGLPNWWSTKDGSHIGESPDPWVREAGNEIRSEHVPEPVTDPLGFRKLFMSATARDIEHNCNVGD